MKEEVLQVERLRLTEDFKGYKKGRNLEIQDHLSNEHNVSFIFYCKKYTDVLESRVYEISKEEFYRITEPV